MEYNLFELHPPPLSMWPLWVSFAGSFLSTTSVGQPQSSILSPLPSLFRRSNPFPMSLNTSNIILLHTTMSPQFTSPCLSWELQIHMFYCLPDLSTWKSTGHCEHNISNTEFCSLLESKLFLHPISSFLINSTPSAQLFRPEIWKVILDFFLFLFPTSNHPSVIKVYQFNLQTISEDDLFIFFCPADLLLLFFSLLVPSSKYRTLTWAFQ